MPIEAATTADLTVKRAVYPSHPGQGIAFCIFSETRFAADSQFENESCLHSFKKGSDPFLFFLFTLTATSGSTLLARSLFMMLWHPLA